MIKDKLEQAVEQCIEAAGHEWEPRMQKDLLRVSLTVNIFRCDYFRKEIVMVLLLDQWI